MADTWDLKNPPNQSAPTVGNPFNNTGHGLGWAGTRSTNISAPQIDPGDLPSPTILPTPFDNRPRRSPPAPPTVPHRPLQLTLDQSIERYHDLANHISPYDYAYPYVNPPQPDILPMDPDPRFLRRRIHEHVTLFSGCSDDILRVIFDCFHPTDAKSRLNLHWALGRIPCMEGEPFRNYIDMEFMSPNWTSMCKNWHGVSEPGSYPHRIRICVAEEDCLSLKPDVPFTLGGTVVRAPNNRHWVCENHIEDNRVIFGQEDFIAAQRIGTCNYHRRQYLRNYPNGFNNCTCERKLNAWMCRRDYIHVREQISRNFRHRVNRPQHWGNGNRVITGANTEHDYTTDKRATRMMLAQRHPCGSGCGRKREMQTDVLDCRSCGGIIVQRAPALPVGLMSGLSIRANRKRSAPEDLYELDSENKRAKPQQTQTRSPESVDSLFRFPPGFRSQRPESPPIEPGAALKFLSCPGCFTRTDKTGDYQVCTVMLLRDSHR